MRPHIRPWWQDLPPDARGVEQTPRSRPSRAHRSVHTPQVDATTAPRHRPFGVIIVALLQLGTIAVALVSYLTNITLPWEGAFAQALNEHSWARAVISLFALLVVLAAVGMWRLRPWGLALMISLVGLALVLDIATWSSQRDQDRQLLFYIRMAMDVVCAFYLNSATVRHAFEDGPTGTPAAIETTDSAGRVDP
jgi:hypothetical protein